MLEKSTVDAEVADGNEDGQGDEKKKKKKRDKVRSAWISFVGRILAQLVGAAATVTLGMMVFHTYSAPSTPISYPSRGGETSVAVLPLENFSADLEHAYLADGMTEALVTDLSKVDTLRVTSRTSTMQFKGQRLSLREIARQLGVRWIVEGSVAQAGKRVRITAQLINADTDQHIWAESYDRPVADVLGLQAEVANTIAGAVEAAVRTVVP